MLTTKEAIARRRSIRRFKPDPIPPDDLLEVLEAARLAPSGCNAQPWRFKVVTEREVKESLAKAAFNQPFIALAPAVIVCCADIRGYLDGTTSAIQDLGKIGAIEDRIIQVVEKRLTHARTLSIDQLGPAIAFNVAIAIEHMVLRALDFDLGTCWIRLLDGPAVNGLFGWDESIYTVALLPIGYPAETPEPRKRMALPDILL
jgi:nitroreductase